MELSGADKKLIDTIADGLPIEAEPYRALGARLGWPETEVLARLGRLQQAGIIKRLGIIVRHHELGYRANAMVVWDIPDAQIETAAGVILREPSVTLCYQRPRRLPDWPYNLFCMIHGRARENVQMTVHQMARALDVGPDRHALLFSTHRYKQRGARYALSTPAVP